MSDLMFLLLSIPYIWMIILGVWIFIAKPFGRKP